MFKFGGWPSWVRRNTDTQKWESGDRQDGTEDILFAKAPFTPTDEIEDPTNLEAGLGSQLDQDQQVLLAMGAEDAGAKITEAEIIGGDTGPTAFDAQVAEAGDPQSSAFSGGRQDAAEAAELQEAADIAATRARLAAHAAKAAADEEQPGDTHGRRGREQKQRGRTNP